MATTFAASITAANSPSPSTSSYCSSASGAAFSPTSGIFQRRPSSCITASNHAHKSSNSYSSSNSSNSSNSRRLSAGKAPSLIMPNMCGHLSPSSGGSPRSSRKRSFAEDSTSIHSSSEYYSSAVAANDASTMRRVKRTRFSFVADEAERDASTSSDSSLRVPLLPASPPQEQSPPLQEQPASSHQEEFRQGSEQQQQQQQAHTATEQMEHEMHAYKESNAQRRTWAQEQYAMLGAAGVPPHQQNQDERTQGEQQRFSSPPPPLSRNREESLVYTSPAHLPRRQPQTMMPTTAAFGGGIHLRFQAIVPSNGATVDDISNRFTDVGDDETSGNAERAAYSTTAAAASASGAGPIGARAQSLAHGRHSMVAVTSFLASRSSLAALPSTSASSSSSSSAGFQAAAQAQQQQQQQQARARIGSLGKVLTSFDELLEKRTASFGGMDELARGSDELKSSMDGLLRMQEEMKKRNTKPAER